jgi:tetratricopeptide (TPR) repeat protein
LQLRASVYESKGDIEKAFDDLDAVIKTNPNEPSPHFKKAMIFFDTDNYRAAIDEFSKAIDIGKKINFSYFENHSHFMRAFCYCKVGDFDAAKSDLDVVDTDTRTWTDRLWTKEDLVEVYLNKRMG